MTDISVTPITESIGADVVGVDLASLTDADFEAIHAAWLAHLVLRFRDQPLDDGQLQAFSARFGRLEEMPLGLMPESRRRKIPNRYVTIISNIEVDGKPIGGLGNAEATWHSDMTYVENPPPASVLLGVEVPDAGGDTWFCSQYGSYDALPDALRRRVEPLRIKHNAAHTSVGSLRPGYEPFADPREAPGAVHPIVSTHPETGRKCLYLGRREWAYVEGLSLADSEALLDELWQYVALPEHTWCQRWRVADVVIWDNRCVMHRRSAFDADARRLMKRCQVLAPA